jgi:hypothetical protein
MKNLQNTILTILIALALFSAASAYGQTSVLDNINCGGGQATCSYYSTNSSGALRCTCTATCLCGGQSSLAASRSIQWGTYVNGFACTLPISVSISGGSERGPGTTTYSSVYVQNVVTGVYVPDGSETSTQQDDCFDGLVVNDPPIEGLC